MNFSSHKNNVINHVTTREQDFCVMINNWMILSQLMWQGVVRQLT